MNKISDEYSVEMDMSGEQISDYFENRDILLKTIMSKLQITEDDLHNQTNSWIMAKIRDSKLEELFTN